MAVTPTIISSRANARVKQLRAAFAGNLRLSEGFVAIEGEHLIEEALRSGITPHVVFVSERREASFRLPEKTEMIVLSESVFTSAAETRSPQGIAALIEPRRYRLDEMMQHPDPLLLIAVGLQDPGNLGTLIRSAEALGAAGVIITSGTVSQWNQKALRASVGSVFRLPVATCTKDEIHSLSSRGVRLLAAVGAANAGVISAQHADLRRGCAILIGNEGSGLSDEWLALATEQITIPCPGPVESLNAAVAGSLLLYEASRQRTTTTLRGPATDMERIPNMQPRRPTGATR
ncbi:TrmH family RNA methyltransferase [Edaphobacter flagellatus]|uniref:TrmH family RNA methyltransferase n=1 Tax=Edaphobacter flagellatus TaxID=1933044 RepID=UPI0021B3CD33|nr:RNA methyltransferase [Edaphobacter flagellatus]